MLSVILTIVNACLTACSVIASVRSVKEAKRQSQIMAEQLEQSKKPASDIDMRLKSISESIQGLIAIIDAKFSNQH